MPQISLSRFISNLYDFKFFSSLLSDNCMSKGVDHSTKQFRRATLMWASENIAGNKKSLWNTTIFPFPHI